MYAAQLHAESFNVARRLIYAEADEQWMPLALLAGLQTRKAAESQQKLMGQPPVIQFIKCWTTYRCLKYLRSATKHPTVQSQGWVSESWIGERWKYEVDSPQQKQDSALVGCLGLLPEMRASNVDD